MVREPTIVDYLEAGLKVSGLRGKVIANNIANLNTPGFKRSAVEFEKLLADVMDASRPTDPGKIQPKIMHPDNSPTDETGNDVSLEAEVGEMVKNSATYKAYVRILTKLYTQMEAAMNVS